MDISILFTTVDGIIFCKQVHSGGMPVAISYVESLKRYFSIWEIVVRCPATIIVRVEGGEK